MTKKTLVGSGAKKKGQNRNSARFKIQYPMKNHCYNAGFSIKLYLEIKKRYFLSFILLVIVLCRNAANSLII